MFSKLIEMIKEALRKMVGYKSITDTVNDVQMYTISDSMKDAITLWKSVYKDEAPWLNPEEGIYSLQLGKEICQSLQSQVMSEMTSTITEPGSTIPKEDESSTAPLPDTRASFLNNQYQKHLLKKLPNKLEQGMALGGMIIKPYVVGKNIYFDFCRQGNFIPIAFDDEENIIDIAFPDQFIAGDYIYTKIERQTFDAEKGVVVVENKAFKAQLRTGDDEDDQQDLGLEVPLSSINRWANISEEPVIIENVDRPLFGFYRVPLANNIDLDTPLGISIFSPALKLIEKADEQFSRLDWEYEGGQMAIDVDEGALNFSQTYFGAPPRMDRVKDRLYRSLDLNSDETYKAFTPTLRDTSYITGLNRYLMRIEDLVGLARGSLSEVQSEARTATEIKILKQRSYITVCRNQEALESALNDAIYAMDVFATLYGLAPDGLYATTTDWKDSILTDTDTELNQKVQLLDANILAKYEVRAWYTGEDEETAKAMIEEIEDSSSNKMMNDLFNQKPENPLEPNEDETEEGEEPEDTNNVIDEPEAGEEE
jgi:A118 family predicted phage portal protein